MENRRVQRLVTHFGVPLESATALVSAGLDTPRKIKAAKVADITKAGAKSADVERIRGKSTKSTESTKSEK